MRTTVTRFKCDAPKCKDVVDVDGPPATSTLQQVSVNVPLPDGWIELQVTGASPGGEQMLVHASKPECAAELAEDQVGQAVEAAEQRAKEEEEAREKAEKAAEEAKKASEENAKDGASGEG